MLVVAGEVDVYSAPQLRLQGWELLDEALTDPHSSPGTPATSTPAVTPPSQDLPGRSGDRNTTAGPVTASGSSTSATGDQQERVVVLDLSAAPFVDSAGMGAMTVLLQKARRRGARLTLAGASPHLTRMLTMMGLTKVVTMHTSVEQAVQTTEATGATGATRTTGQA